MKLSVKKIISNSGWLFFEKGTRIGISFIVSLWFARYLGPFAYGIWNYCTAIYALFLPIAGLGLEAIVIRQLVKFPGQKNEILGTSFFLKLFAGIIVFALALLFIFFSNREHLHFILVVITSASAPFLSTEVIDYYFQSKVESKYSVFAKFLSFLISSALRVFMIVNEYSLVQFAWINFIEVLLSGIFLILVYLLNREAPGKWKFNFSIAKKLFADSAPLMLSGVVIMIYMRIDQIMLGNMISNDAVGNYSAAIKLIESWYIIPTTISSTLFPYFISIREKNYFLYKQSISRFLKYMTAVSVFVAFIVTLFSEKIIVLLFGPQYLSASTVLSVTVWAAVFVFIGVVSQNWFVAENMQRHQLLRVSFGAIINVVLNIILIPVYGITGAAFATLIAQFFASYFANIMGRSTREMFMMQTNALLKVFSLYFIYELVTKNRRPK